MFVPSKFGPRFHYGLVTLILFVLAAGTVIEGYPQSFVTCKINCGETFDALAHIEDYRVNGLKYGLIEVISSSDDPDVRPILYTHNVNLGGIVFTLLEVFGVTSLAGKQLVTLGAFLAGLLYAYRTTVLFTRSRLAGLIVLLLFATEIEHVLSFSLNALRAWHWLALFGVLFHASHLALYPEQQPWRHRLGLLLMAALAFGIGYDFLAISMAVAGCSMLLLAQRRLSFRQYVMLVAWFGVAFLTPVALRQAQIISVLGFHFWSTDLYYSAVIKVNLLSRILPLPPMEQIEQFYVAERVLRPPATPATSLESILRTARDLVIAVTIPSVGMVTSLLSALVGAVAVVVAVTVAVWGWLSKPVQSPTPDTSVNQFRTFGIGTSQLTCILLIGTLVGLTPFAPLSLHIYLKHQFPLVAAPLIVMKGAVLAALILTAMRFAHVSRVASIACLGVAALILGDHALIQLESKRSVPSLNMAWIRFVQERPHATYVVSGLLPGWVEPFSDGQVGFLPVERDIELLGMMRAGRQTDDLRQRFVPPVTIEDPLPPAIVNADYWLYASADLTASFDKLSSECRSDLIMSATAGGFRSGKMETPQLSLKGVWPTVVAPGATVSIVGDFDRPLPPNSSIGVAFADEVPILPPGQMPPPPAVSDLSRLQLLEYNCPRNLVQGRFTVPKDTPAGQRQLLIMVSGPDGAQIVNGQSHITVNPSEPPSSIPPVRIPTVPPTVAEMVATGTLKIAERGDGYVVFDVRR